MQLVFAINKGTKGCEASSYDKESTTLLDECKRSIETDVVPVKDKRYMV